MISNVIFNSNWYLIDICYGIYWKETKHSSLIWGIKAWVNDDAIY